MPAGRDSASTISQLYMESREMSNFGLKKVTKKIAKEKATADMESGTAPYTYQSPVAISGDIADLFGPDSVQNREVCPGDFVEIRRDGKTSYGIFIQDFDQSENRLKSTTLTVGSKKITHRTADVVFRIPRHLLPDKIKAVVEDWDVEFNPASPPIAASKMVAMFVDEAMLLLGTFYSKFDTVYDTFWNDRKQKTITTLQVARFVFDKEGGTDHHHPEPSNLQEIYASHLFLTQDVNLLKFNPSIAVRWTGEFAMRPPQDVLLTETVIDWIRNSDPEIDCFVKKAKVLIENSRQDDKSKWKKITFTDSDRILIEFVKEAALNGYNDIFTQPHLTYLPKLLRPMEAYDDIDAGTAFKFLNEIGIWPNWHNMEIKRSGISV
ncbi:hypothetical protein BGZ65_004809 [Modicella reniformis]|uniref:Uncharacterized protein n=1 Tax=Modicella reniformis TaxID=1440133 RepID=A0A9P6LYP4_9FUNG|nr:hypothetical protein BGZ65_004809 [Modicella reniformis]